MYAPILATAAARWRTAFSLVGTEPCPEGPRAITATSTGTFSLACTATYCTLPFFRTTLPPSLMAKPAANLSQYFAMSILMLASPPCSSSAVARKITSRFRWMFERFKAMNAARLAVNIPLSSMEPRPYRKPSLITAPKGSTDHLDLSTPTTSMCATNSTARDGSGMAALRRRATNALRPGERSKNSDGIPSLVRMPAMYLAAACSLPGGFVVSMRMRPASQPSASFASAVVSPTGDCVDWTVGIAVDGACAARGEAAARDNSDSATAEIIISNLKFPFTKTSSGIRVRCGQGRPAQQRFALNALHTNM